MDISGNYAISFINDEQLPPEQDFALLEFGDETHLVIKESRLTERVLEDAWAAFRERLAG